MPTQLGEFGLKAAVGHPRHRGLFRGRGNIHVNQSGGHAAWRHIRDGTNLAVPGRERNAFMNKSLQRILGSTAAVGVAAAAGYAGLVAWHRYRYGKAVAPAPGQCTLLDRFIPAPEVIERHQIRVHAPAEVVMAAARDSRLLDSALVRGIFKAREIALGGEPDVRTHPDKLFEQMASIGWVMLAEQPGREVVMGAATVPWHAHPVFRSIAAADFEAFREPGYVKIAWSLRAEPIDHGRSIFHTETRVSTTDPQARKQFRRYWSYVAPGVELIRIAMLRPVKQDAERRAQSVAA